jgi:hypothetical protein
MLTELDEAQINPINYTNFIYEAFIDYTVKIHILKYKLK